MRSRHTIMSLAEFRLLPRDPGWRYEYFDEMAHVTPRARFATVRVGVGSRPLEPPLPLRGVVASDREELRAAYVAAFADSVEFCDVPPEGISRSARENIRDFYAGDRGGQRAQAFPAIELDVLAGVERPAAARGAQRSRRCLLATDGDAPTGRSALTSPPGPCARWPSGRQRGVRVRFPPPAPGPAWTAAYSSAKKPLTSTITCAVPDACRQATPRSPPGPRTAIALLARVRPATWLSEEMAGMALPPG